MSAAQIGILLQALGTVAVTIQLWGRAWAFDTTFGLTDERGYWKWIIRLGLVVLLVGYFLSAWSVR